jgi:hypothetical protein
MIITEKQLIILCDIAKWFIKNEFHNFGVPYDRETIIHLLNDILNQQSNELIEVK